MSELINLTRKAEQLQGFQLATREDMWTALQWLLDNGYTGNINGYEPGKISLSFADTKGGGQTGFISDWIVLINGTIARIYTNETAIGLFDAAP